MDKETELEKGDISDALSSPIKIVSVRFSEEAPINPPSETTSAEFDASKHSQDQVVIIDPIQKELPGLFEGIANMKISDAAPEVVSVHNDVVDLSEENKDGILII